MVIISLYYDSNQCSLQFKNTVLPGNVGASVYFSSMLAKNLVFMVLVMNPALGKKSFVTQQKWFFQLPQDPSGHLGVGEWWWPWGGVGLWQYVGTWCSGCGLSRETTSCGSEVEFHNNITDGADFSRENLRRLWRPWHHLCQIDLFGRSWIYRKKRACVNIGNKKSLVEQPGSVCWECSQV